MKNGVGHFKGIPEELQHEKGTFLKHQNAYNEM